MTRDEAAAILGLQLVPYPANPWTAESIRAAFAAAVKAQHPDTADPRQMTGPSIGTLKKARGVLLAAADISIPTECVTCRGSGWVASGFKQERCPRGC